MPDTTAIIGYDTKYEISIDAGGSFVEVLEVFDVTPPSATINMVDATHYRSPNKTREFIAGLNDAGQSSFSINWVPGSAADLLMQSLVANRTKLVARITYPNGVIWTHSGLVMTYTPAVPLDDKMTAEVAIKVSSSITTSNADAPTNTLAPAISGLAKVATVLTALTGTWTGVPTFTYQWKKAGTNIAGATGATYTPVTGDIAGALTVAVTGTNNAGNATVTSAATAAVIA